MTGLMDPKFKYVPAAETNVAKTFARIRKQLKEKAEREAQEAAAKKSTVRVLSRRDALSSN